MTRGAAAVVVGQVLVGHVGVGGKDVIVVGLAHVVTQVEVGVEFGEEVERVVELDVTVGTVDVGVVFGLVDGGDGVVGRVVLQVDSTAGYGPGFGITVEEVTESTGCGSARNGSPVTHGKSRVERHGSADGEKQCQKYKFDFHCGSKMREARQAFTRPAS